MAVHPTIWIEGTLTIDGKAFSFAVDNDIDSGFDHDGYSSQAYNIVNDLNGFVKTKEVNKVNKGFASVDTDDLDIACDSLFGHTDWEFVADTNQYITIKFNVEDTREEE